MEFIINIDTRKKAGAELVKFLKSLSFVKVKEKNETEENTKLYRAMMQTNNDKHISRKKIMDILEK